MRANHHIYNLELTLADTEYSQALSEHVKYFSIKSRSPTCDLRFSSVEGETGEAGPYKSIFGPSEWNSGPPDLQTPSARTIYIRGTEAGTVVEIEEWT